MNFYSEDVARMARENEDFRRVLFTTERSQLVLMALEPGEEIGEEVHEGIDQVLAFVEGEGEAVIEGESRPVRAGYQMHLPKPVEPAELIAVVASLTGRE